MVQKLISSAVSILSRQWTSKIIAAQSLYQHHQSRSIITTVTAQPKVQSLDSSKKSELLLSDEDIKDFFRLDGLFTVNDLFEARVHFGHKENMLNNYMQPYIFGKRLGVLIFDLEQTATLLRQALQVTAEMTYRDGLVLFIHRSRQNGHLVEKAAKDCGEFAYCRRWDDQIFANSTRYFGSIIRLPDLVIMFSTLGIFNNTHRAVTLSAKMLIPTIAICDTNSDPKLITYPIPGNDDTPQSIELYCHLFKTAVLRGKEKKKEILEKYGLDFYNKTIE